MARKTQRPTSSHTILVVDDQEEVLHSVRILLEREGHRVLTAASGEDALALFKESEVHLLLIDYFLPGMTGEELIREIRTFDPYVQIILQTGYAGEKPARQMLAELEVQGYHDKSEGPDKLLMWVDVGLKAARLITMLRERERLQRDMVSNVSHEFRTPLHIIGGYAELLLDDEFGALPETARRPLQQVATATNRLADLVTDLLRYAKLESGVDECAMQWVSTAEMAEEMERWCGVLLDDRAVRFELDLELAPEGCLTDPVKLRTILRNLIANAVKFTPRGRIALRIAQVGSTLQFALTDSGIGIALEHQELIFEPFRQLDGSPTRHHRGIGLGLALSRKLARILGGALAVDSQPGMGSTFTLTLPVHAVAEREEPVSSEDFSRSSTPLGEAAHAA